MKRHDLFAGLAAGGFGIAALLLCLFVLKMTLILSGVVALVVCVAVMLIAPGGPLEVVMRTKPTPEQQKAIDAVRQHIADIAESARQVESHSPRGAGLIRQVVAKMTMIIDVIAEDRNKFASAEPFLSTIQPIVTFFPVYVKLVKRNVKTAEATIKDAEERQLPRLIGRFDNLFERLHSYDAAWLETETEFSLPNIGDVELKLEGGQP